MFRHLRPLRLTLLLFLLLVHSAPAVAVPDPALLAPLVELESRGARVSATFFRNGGEVVHLHGDRLLNPASVAKVFTAAVALSELGADHTLPTQVRVVGKAPDAVEIAISTRGDPLLRARDLDSLARCVAEAGFKSAQRLTIVLDPFNGAHVPPAFDRKSTDAAYRAGVAGFQVDRNAIVVSIAPGATGQPPRVTVTPESDAVRIVNTAVTAAPGKGRGPEPSVVVVPAQDGTLEVRVSGRSPAKRSIAVSKRVEDPAAHAGGAFRAALRRAGVRVKGGAKVGPMPSGGRSVCSRTSASVKDMLLPVLHDSINPIAETLLRLVGAHQSERAVGFTEGARVLGDWLRNRVGIPAAAFKFSNGSGLYDANRVSSRAIVRLLTHARDDARVRALTTLMPLAGVDGTVKRRFKGTSLAGNLRAKTGTLDNAVALAGSATLPDGTHFDFAVIVNAGDCKDGPGCDRLDLPAVRRAIDRAVVAVWRSVGGPEAPPAPESSPAPAKRQP